MRKRWTGRAVWWRRWPTSWSRTWTTCRGWCTAWSRGASPCVNPLSFSSGRWCHKSWDIQPKFHCGGSTLMGQKKYLGKCQKPWQNWTTCCCCCCKCGNDMNRIGMLPNLREWSLSSMFVFLAVDHSHLYSNIGTHLSSCIFKRALSFKCLSVLHLGCWPTAEGKRGLNDTNQPVARLKRALTLLDDTEIAHQQSITEIVHIWMKNIKSWTVCGLWSETF